MILGASATESAATIIETDDNSMSAAYATEHVSMSDQVTHDDVELGAGVENAQTVARLLAEMEQVDLYIIDVKGHLLPLWSSPHGLLPDVAAVLQQRNAAQLDMRAFFTSPVLAEVRALRRKYVTTRCFALMLGCVCVVL